MEDKTIIELFFSREESAITAVRDTYGSYCARIAGNILDSEEDVDEILNDTWLKVWNSIPPQHPENLKLYIARIVRNLSFDRFRSQNREKRGGGEPVLALQELSECIPSAECPDSRMEAAQLKQAVSTFLETLPRRDRKIFLLRYYYVETAPEIAARLGIRPTLVRTSLSRTRKKLKTHLMKEGWLE